ncbi:uncharacterized protein LOC125074822 isoform X1 [Vanessa atalanta]|uniref:uncharacterized protein LOC125074822 isoform X1 n=1 Tax=Vanessa atalanta TaxID=42275 RepID=UPI001FCDB21D|nr:uncharacterized protein LOC125074822 isoform X1 [Vanessa atalanta]
MTDNINCSRHISYEQFKILIDFMGQHVGLATGSARTLEARHKSKSLWNELTKMLNNTRSGTRKTSDGWSKYWSDFKNKLKNKVRLIKKRKRPGASKNIINPLTRLEKRALIILGPHFGGNMSKVSVDPFNNLISCPPEVKLEAYQENGHDDLSFMHSDSSDRCSVERDSSMSENSNEEFDDESEEEPNEPTIQSIYPKWLIEVEKKRAEADLSRSKAEEKRAIISEKNADAALVQAEALKNLAEAATVQANALVRIATLLENRGERENILPI